MQITLKKEIISFLLKSPIKSMIESKISHWDLRQLQEKGDDSEIKQTYTYDLVLFSKTDLPKLLKQLEITEGISTITVETVKRWIETLSNPENAVVTSLNHFEKVFDALYKKLQNKWLMYKQTDGTFNPVLVTDFKYKQGTRDNASYFYINIAYGLYIKAQKDSTSNVTDVTEQFEYYKGSVNEELDADYFFGSDVEDDEDDEKPKTKKKGEGVLLSTLLERKSLYIPTKDVLEKYIDQQKKFLLVAKHSGAMYNNEGYVYELGTYSSYSSKYNRTLVSAQDDGVENKLVVDLPKEPEIVKKSRDTKTAGSQPLPFHPYVLMYDITKHRRIISHVTLFKPYRYNKEIINELVLPGEQKDLLMALCQGEQLNSDIIKGKSGGIIVLNTGVQGTGKTLTAEVYSEVLRKPLYQIQSAQLGIKIEDIENNLYAVLKRAQRWNAVLLIDECDTYVYERGEDMMQNCIVGTFLRLLEYFNGVMFMTTNRADIVDAAIMSRVTAHIHFAVPEVPMQCQIAEVLCKRYDIVYNEEEATNLFETYIGMTGRDIRNLLKLLRKFYFKEKVIHFTAEAMKPILNYIPFLNSKNLKKAKGLD